MSAALLEIADRLYAEPLGDFTPARDAAMRDTDGSNFIWSPVKRIRPLGSPMAS